MRPAGPTTGSFVVSSLARARAGCQTEASARSAGGCRRWGAKPTSSGARGRRGGAILPWRGAQGSPNHAGGGEALGSGGDDAGEALRWLGSVPLYTKHHGWGPWHQRHGEIRRGKKGVMEEVTGFTIGNGEKSGNWSSCRSTKTREKRRRWLLMGEETGGWLEAPGTSGGVGSSGVMMEP
jgi:hypothetical protein